LLRNVPCSFLEDPDRLYVSKIRAGVTLDATSQLTLAARRIFLLFTLGDLGG